MLLQTISDRGSNKSLWNHCLNLDLIISQLTKLILKKEVRHTSPNHGLKIS